MAKTGTNDERLSMMNLHLLLACLIAAIVLPGTNSATSGIGGCVSGTAAVSAQVVNKTDGRPVVTGQLADVGIEISIGGVLLNVSAPVEVPAGVDLAVALSAEQLSYLEVLIRVEVPPEAMTPVLIPRANTEVAEFCKSPIVGLTNIDSEEKTLSTGNIRADEVVDAVVDVTVVFLNSDVGSAYVYDKYDVRFVETESSQFMLPENSTPPNEPISDAPSSMSPTGSGGVEGLIDPVADEGLIDPVSAVMVNGTLVVTAGDDSSTTNQDGDGLIDPRLPTSLDPGFIDPRLPTGPDPGFIDPGFIPTYSSTTSSQGPPPYSSSSSGPPYDSTTSAQGPPLPTFDVDSVLDVGYVSSMGTPLTDRQSTPPSNMDPKYPHAEEVPTPGLDTGYLYSATMGTSPLVVIPAPAPPSPTLPPEHPWYANGNDGVNNGPRNGGQRQMMKGRHGMMMMKKNKGMKMKKKKGKKGTSGGFYQQDGDYYYNSPKQYVPVPAYMTAPKPAAPKPAPIPAVQHARTTGFFHRPKRHEVPPVMPPVMPPRQQNGFFHRPRKHKQKHKKYKHPKRT